MLSVFSACGRRLLPPILLPSPISTLHCTGPYVMALTAAATLSVWDVHRQEVVVKEELGNERGLEEIATQQWVPGVKDLEWGTLREIFTWDKFPRADMTGAQYQKQ